MHTTKNAIEFFGKETLYDLLNIARTSAHRFIIRASNIATGEEQLFLADLSINQLNKLPA